ncbi:hypothetical protein Bbelb_285560 [Branchiostoma belcheri]|nr:hypothetical protein Bbelb_285560 [Branchiostoma belcheri]
MTKSAVCFPSDCDPVTYDLCQEVMPNTTDMWGMLGNFSDDVMDGNDTFVDMMSVIESGCHDNASLLVCSACLDRPLCQSLCDDVMEQCDDILEMFDVTRQCEGLPNELDPIMQCISRGVCPEGELECWSPGWNGTEPHCVNASLACDGDWDCPFGEDEDHCDGRCTSWQFQCDQDFPGSESGSGNSSSPECVHPWQVCDGVRDCSSGEDERDCGSVCLPGEKECWSPGGNASCVDSGLVCDGVRDCFLGEDEDDCHNGTHNCTEGEIECFSWAGNMTCVSPSLRCDGNWDCPFGEDEDSCDGQCSSWQFQCDVDFPTGNGPSPTGPNPSPPECIDPWQVCDGTPDCSTGGDEANCVMIVFSQPRLHSRTFGTTAYVSGTLGATSYVSRTLGTTVFVSRTLGTTPYVSRTLGTTAYVSRTLGATTRTIGATTRTFGTTTRTLGTTAHVSRTLGTTTYVPRTLGTTSFLTRTLGTTPTRRSMRSG